MAGMNLIHRWLCGSARWKQAVETYILPWTLEGLDLGSNVLEVGPGPGITTDLLRSRVRRLTCVEVNRSLTNALRRRQLDGKVQVVCEDATAMSFPDQTFDGAVCFTMLHHVPSIAMQDRLLREVASVLRQGARFAGTDSLYSRSFRLLHILDTMVVVDPATFPDRLKAAGFDEIQVDVMDPYAFHLRRAGVVRQFLPCHARSTARRAIARKVFEPPNS